MESAEAFAAESSIAEVGGIAVASVIPPSVRTSRQAESRNQKRDKDNQFYFHYLMRRQAGRRLGDRRACIQDASQRPYLLVET
jgi:hypothetical protein